MPDSGAIAMSRALRDLALPVKGIDPETVLLDMKIAVKADAQDSARLLIHAGISAGSQMGEVSARGITSRDAAAVRLHPAAMPRPDLSWRRCHTRC